MTPETKLLLSVARILRARIKEDPAHPYYKDDLEALNDALAPFDPSNVVPIRPDECAQQAAPEPAPLNRVEALAEAWASFDGQLDRFRACQSDPKLAEARGHYQGYMADAEEMIRRLEKRGFTVTPLAQQAAPEPAEPCRSCGGTGKHHGQWLDTDQTCPDCNGTGLKAKGDK